MKVRPPIGQRQNRNRDRHLPRSPAIVKLIPSIATDPLCTIHCRVASGTRTFKVQSVVCSSNSCSHAAPQAPAPSSRRRRPRDPAPHARPADSPPPSAIPDSPSRPAPGPQRSPVQRLLRQVGVKINRVHIQRRQTHAGNRQRITLTQPRRNPRRLHGQPPHAAAIHKADQRPRLLNNSGKHGSILKRTRDIDGARLSSPLSHCKISCITRSAWSV